MMNALLYTLIFFVLPLAVFTVWLCYVLWYTFNSNSGVYLRLSWQTRPLIAFKIQNSTPDWKEMWR